MQVNQESNLVNRVVRLEQLVEEIRKLAGATSSIISRGGQTLLNNSFLKMLDSTNLQILYIGPGPDGVRQQFVLRRDGGSYVFVVNAAFGSVMYWSLQDRAGNELITDDPVVDIGLGRPWLDVTMYPKFAMAAGTFPYQNIAVASVTSETQLWAGTLGLVSHPRIRVYGIWGQATGANSCTYRLKEAFGGPTLVSWSTGALVTDDHTADISAQINRSGMPIEITAQASGTGTIACQVLGCIVKGSLG